jgi:neutral ceramidase
VVLSGLSGTYSSYITTWEEYQVQRYEGASTLYGPHTLDAYIQTVLELVQVTERDAPDPVCCI